MRNFYTFLILAVLFSPSFYSCKKDTGNTALTVLEQLNGEWKGDSMQVDVAINGLEIDSLSQTILTDSLMLVLREDSSYEFFVGNVGYKGTFDLKHNDSEIVIEDFGQMINSYLPDSIETNIDQQIFIETLDETKLVLNGQTFANVVIDGQYPIQIQLKTMSYFHKVIKALE